MNLKKSIALIRKYKHLPFIAFTIGAVLFFFIGSNFAIHLKMKNQSKTYSKQVIPRITSKWEISEIQPYLSSTYKQRIAWNFFYKSFSKYKEALGPIQKINKVTSTTDVQFINKKMNVKANVIANATFKKRNATIAIDLLKENNKWKINNFRISL